MSISVKVRTKKKDLDYNHILNSLADGVYPLVVKLIQPEICEFYQHRISTRPIDDITLEDNGYEIRITTLACREDYELFAKTIDLVQKMQSTYSFLKLGIEDNSKLDIFVTRKMSFNEEVMGSCLNAALRKIIRTRQRQL